METKADSTSQEETTAALHPSCLLKISVKNRFYHPYIMCQISYVLIIYLATPFFSSDRQALAISGEILVSNHHLLFCFNSLLHRLSRPPLETMTMLPALLSLLSNMQYSSHAAGDNRHCRKLETMGVSS